MRIAIQSSSASVTRTLEAIISASRHQLVSGNDAPDLVIEDSLNPASAPIQAAAKLLLVANTAAGEQEIACPIRPERLIQRLTALGTTQTFTLGNGWSLDMLARDLQHASGANCALTEKECSLLRHLALAHPVPVNRDTLLEQVWGVAGSIDTHTLETHIYRLRAKLGDLTPTPCDIITIAGAYALALGEESR